MGNTLQFCPCFEAPDAVDLPHRRGPYGSVPPRGDDDKRRSGRSSAPGILVVMRHSVRLDSDATATWSDKDARPYDTPISDWRLPAEQAALLQRHSLAQFDEIVVSPFRRCLQTAGVCAQALGTSRICVDRDWGEMVPSVRRIQRECWGDEIAERPHGVVEYLSAQDELALLRSASNGAVSAVAERRGATPPPGETHAAGHARFVRAVEALRDNEVRSAGKRVLVVTHGDAVAAAIKALTGEECYETEECCWAAFGFSRGEGGDDRSAKQLGSSRIKTLSLG